MRDFRTNEYFTDVELEDIRRAVARKNNRRKKIRHRRRSRILSKLAIAISIIFLIALAFGRSNSYAKGEKDDIPVYKYYTSVCIEKGDTLSSIAADHISSEYRDIDDYIDEVRFINHIPADDDFLQIGTYIIVPYYSTELK